MYIPRTELVPFLFHFSTGAKASFQLDWTDCYWFFLHRERIGLIGGVHNRTNETTTLNWSRFCFVQYLMQRSYKRWSPIDICETRCIQHATYLLSIEDGVTKRNKNGKVLGCGTHLNMGSFHHPRLHHINHWLGRHKIFRHGYVPWSPPRTRIPPE